MGAGDNEESAGRRGNQKNTQGQRARAEKQHPGPALLRGAQTRTEHKTGCRKKHAWGEDQRRGPTKTPAPRRKGHHQGKSSGNTVHRQSAKGRGANRGQCKDSTARLDTAPNARNARHDGVQAKRLLRPKNKKTEKGRKPRLVDPDSRRKEGEQMSTEKTPRTWITKQRTLVPKPPRAKRINRGKVKCGCGRELKRRVLYGWGVLVLHLEIPVRGNLAGRGDWFSVHPQKISFGGTTGETTLQILAKGGATIGDKSDPPRTDLLSQ